MRSRVERGYRWRARSYRLTILTGQYCEYSIAYRVTAITTCGVLSANGRLLPLVRVYLVDERAEQETSAYCNGGRAVKEMLDDSDNDIVGLQMAHINCAIYDCQNHGGDDARDAGGDNGTDHFRNGNVFFRRICSYLSVYDHACFHHRNED